MDASLPKIYETTTTTIRSESTERLQRKNYQQAHLYMNPNPKNEQILIQVVTRDEIEKPLKLEISNLNDQVMKLQNEQSVLKEENAVLSKHLYERQTYIETYKEKYMDMEKQKQLMLSELERLNASRSISYNDDKLRMLLKNKEDEVLRLQEKYRELEQQGLGVLQDKLISLSNEKEYWRTRCFGLKQ